MGRFTASIRFSNQNDVDFIYESLKNMAIEEGLLDRFSLTKQSLFDALFSKNHFAEVLIVEFAGDLAGLCSFSVTNRNFNLFKSSGIYVHDVYVVPDWRRYRIASTLLNKVIDIARDRGCDRVDGVVIKNNNLGQSLRASLKNFDVVDYIDYVRAKL